LQQQHSKKKYKIKNDNQISKKNSEVKSKGEKEQIKVDFALNKQRLKTVKQEL